MLSSGKYAACLVPGGGSPVARTMTRSDLADLVRTALEAADALGQHNAAIHLDRALVDLVGAGTAPRSFVSPAGIDQF